MSHAHAVIHHDPSAAAIAVQEMEAQRRREHAARQVRQLQLYTLGRFFVAILFLVSAVAKLTDYRATVNALDPVLSDPGMLVPLAIGIELVGGALLLVGLKARTTAGFLIAYLATVTLLVHHDLALVLNRTFALANLAFAGALLMIMAHGAGALSVDKLLEQRRRG